MGRGSQGVIAGLNTNITYKITGAITDADLNKPVKLSATDLVALCSDGDEIYGFINSVERGTQDGKVVVGVQVDGRTWVTLSGSSTIGAVVEAGANEAAGTALGTNWGVVSTHTPTTDTIAHLVASTFKKNWMIISGSGDDASDVLIEKQ